MLLISSYAMVQPATENCGGGSEQIAPTLTANCPRLQKVVSPTAAHRWDSNSHI